jgi:DNA-binding response OmpR family regulator
MHPTLELSRNNHKRVPAVPCILLAEDDDAMRDLIAATLREDGYEVTEVRDGGRLLVQLGNKYLSTQRPWESFDLIVSDIRMPVCSGLRIVEALRRAGWPTPMILMTAFGDEQTRMQAADLRAVLFDKPFDLDDLRSAVVRLLMRPPCSLERPTHESWR